MALHRSISTIDVAHRLCHHIPPVDTVWEAQASRQILTFEAPKTRLTEFLNLRFNKNWINPSKMPFSFADCHKAGPKHAN